MSQYTPAEGMIEGATASARSVTPHWDFIRHEKLIEGVRLKEVKNVPTSYGWLTEIWRSDWRLDANGAEQVFVSELAPGEISGWHVHMKTWDRLSVTRGALKIVLYDARAGSPTEGIINEFTIGPRRPGTASIPPGVWHGVINVDAGATGLVNVVSRAYSYDEPDHFRLPPDTPRIPYDLNSQKARGAGD